MLPIRDLAPELEELAKIECNEDKDEIPGKIEEFRNWVLEHKNLKGRTDAQFLVAFLRHCKYDLDKAKERYYFYYEYQSVSGLQGSHSIDEKLLEICDSGVFATLIDPIGPGGPRIHVTRMGLIDTNKFNVKDLFRYHIFRSELEICQDDNWNIAGVIEIIDFHKMPYAILKQFEPSLFRKMASLLEYGLPTNLRATHVINASLDVQMVLSIARSLMKEKELLRIHTTLESLHKAIDVQYLPTDYGGTNGTMSDAVKVFKQKIVAMTDHFKENSKYGVVVPSPRTSRKVESSTNDTASEKITSLINKTFKFFQTSDCNEAT